MTRPLPPDRCALLVVDMVEDFFKDPRLRCLRRALAQRTNRLVQLARRHRWTVIWVRQEFRSDLSDASLEVRRKRTRLTIAGTRGVQFLPELDRAASDMVLLKKRYSAFFGTSLDDVLHRRRIGVIVVCGVNTHACVRMSAIDAYQRDYAVYVVRDCVNSYDVTHHRISLRYMSNKIALVPTVSQLERRIAKGISLTW